ncbi:MAG: hypothetical protein ACREKE_05320 [bacterium]
MSVQEDLMGTTSTSGWAVLTFLVGFMLLGTACLGSVPGAVVGVAFIVASVVLFQKAKTIEA